MNFRYTLCILLGLLATNGLATAQVPDTGAIAPATEHAIDEMLAGHTASARAGFEQILATGPDSLNQSLALEALTFLLFNEQDWPALAALLDTVPTDPETEDAFGFCRHFTQLPAQQVQCAGPSATLRLGHDWAATARVNGQRTRMVLDTGAGISILSHSMAKRLGVRTVANGLIVAQSASEHAIPLRPGVIDSLRIGPLLLCNHPVGVVADEALEFRFLGIKILDYDAILGWPALRHAVWTFNPSDRQVTVSAPVADSTQPRNLAWYGMPLVSAVLLPQNQPTLWELDLGGDDTQLYTQFWQHFPATTALPAETFRVWSAGGSRQYTTPSLAALTLHIGGKALVRRNVRTRPPMLPTEVLQPDGVLGRDVADGGHIIILDAPNGRFDLR